MDDKRRAALRSIMGMAWDFKRAEPDRAFADCLRGAWKLSKRLDAEGARLRRLAQRSGGALRFSPALYSSPVFRATRRQAKGRYADYKGAYTTARLGA